jgi:hypothetical protein
MTRATEQLRERLQVETITPQRALVMLLTGVMSEEAISTLRPAKTSLDSMTKMLDHATAKRRNRKVSIPRVLRMSRDMTNGNWRFTGIPVMVEDDGFVLDGQHRLLAIMHSGVRQEVVILYGATTADQLVTDTGRPRTAGDQLSIRQMPHARHVAAAANLLMRWRAGQILNSQFQPTVTETTVLAEETEGMHDAATLALRIHTAVKHAPIAAIMASYIEASEIDNDQRDYFFERLQRGDELTTHDPILTLRNTFMRYNPDNPVPFRHVGRLWQIVNSWNKMRAGQKVQVLRVPPTLSSDSFPRMK